MAFECIEDQAVVEQNLRRGGSYPHCRGDELEGLGRAALGQLDQAHHLQGVDVIGACSPYQLVERLGVVDASALVQFYGLRKSLRDVKRPGFWLEHRDSTPDGRGKKVWLSRLEGLSSFCAAKGPRLAQSGHRRRGNRLFLHFVRLQNC